MEPAPLAVCFRLDSAHARTIPPSEGGTRSATPGPIARAPCSRGWFCASGSSHPGLSGAKLGGAEAELRGRSRIRSGAARDLGQLRETRRSAARCSLRRQGAGARQQRQVGSSGGSAKKTPLLPLSDSPGTRLKDNTPFLPPFLAAPPPGTLPKCPRPWLWPRRPAEEAAATELGIPHFMGRPWGGRALGEGAT